MKKRCRNEIGITSGVPDLRYIYLRCHDMTVVVDLIQQQINQIIEELMSELI